MLFSYALADLVTCLDSKIPLKKKTSLEWSTVIRVVSARLLVAEKLSDIFSLEHLNKWELRIKRENALKTLKSQQYLTPVVM